MAATSIGEAHVDGTGVRGAFRSGLLWKACVPLVVLTLLWIRVFLAFAHVSQLPHADPAAVDFAHNMAGASVMRGGGNPYDSVTLTRGQDAYLRSHGVPGGLRGADPGTTWAGYPPLYLWLLQPFVGVTFPLLALGWMAVTGTLLAVATVLCLWFLGWSSRALPTLLVLLTPQTTLQLYYANPAGLVLAVILGAIALHRRWPFCAGLLLALTWLKPQLGLPSLLLIVLFSSGGKRRIIAGFGVGSTMLLALTLLGPGMHSLILWVRGMMGVSDMAGAQPNMIPLVGLYAGWASHPVHTALEGLTVVSALGLTGWWWRRTRDLPELRFEHVAWLWPVWLLALPYAHFPDEMLLLPAVLAVLRPNGANITRFGPAVCVYLLYVSTVLYNVEIGRVQLLAFPLLAIAFLMYREAAGMVSSSGLGHQDGMRLLSLRNS